MRTYKEFQKEAVRVWNPKDNTFYPLTNFNSFPVLFKVMKKGFPKFLNSFTVKICYEECGDDYLILCLLSTLAVLCVACSPLPWGEWSTCRYTEHFKFLSVLLCEMKVIMLLMVRVQPLCTFREIFVLLFPRFWFHMSLLCCSVGFILLGKM